MTMNGAINGDLKSHILKQYVSCSLGDTIFSSFLSQKNGHTLKYEKSVNFLGMMFDSRLY